MQNINKNSGEESKSNIYSLYGIISFTGLPILLIFLFPCIEVVPDWYVIKCIKRADFLIFIANNLLVALKWKMKRSTYLIDDSDL